MATPLITEVRRATCRVIASSLLALVLAAPALAGAPDRPDPSLTPGAVRPGVTEADLCPVAHTGAVRHVTEATKRAVLKGYGLRGKREGWCSGPEGCEIDHLISLELGGSNDIKNLWPQSYDARPWNAHLKDKLEDRLHRLVCTGAVSLETAQRAIAADWIAAYRRYVGGADK